MRIITPKRIQQWAKEHSDAESSLLGWMSVAEMADWSNLRDVRKQFRHADPVKVASGKTVTIFNIKGNRYRLITAIHYHTGIIFALRFLSHAQYDKDKWKRQL